ncbi:MAG: IclR family transcriptional regulator [Pseudomonadota bacterium]
MATQINGSVVKAFKILDLFTEGRSELTATEVARALKINMITAHRFLHTLEHIGALVMVSRGVFRLGYLFAELGDRALRDGGLAAALQPVLDQLALDLGEACMVTVFERDMAVCIAKALPDRPLYVDIRIGSRLDAFCTAHGKLWLAFMEEDQRDAWLNRTRLQAITANTITNQITLRQELDLIRRDGYALNNAEREKDIYALAVPVTNRNGKMISALSVFGASASLITQNRPTLLTRLQKAAKSCQTGL